MSPDTRYNQFAQNIDACESEQELKQFQNKSSLTAMQKEFWKQRQLTLSTADPLKKQKASVKMQWLQHFFGCNIAPRRSIKKFTAPNGLFGIFIAPEAAVDENCVIFQQVYIGGDTFADSPWGGFPTIGKNVYIGAGAKIVGNCTVGDNARIDANCFVNFDVPANSHVANTGNYAVTEHTAQDNRHLSAQQYFEGHFDNPAVDCSSIDTLSVHKATSADIDDIICLYKDRINWFRWKKISQWIFYLTHHPREEFVQKIEQGCYYIIKDGDKTVAGFAVSTDSENWNDNASNAYYLSRAISLVWYRHMGSYIAQQAKQIAQQDGKDFLRLECVHGNTRLNEIWQSLGFDYAGDAQGSYHCALRQMDLRPESEREPVSQQTQDTIPNDTDSTVPEAETAHTVTAD